MHYVRLSMDFICLEEISSRISLKTPLFPLARVYNVFSVPMEEIIQRGRASWRSILELCPCQPSLEKLFNKCTPKGFFLRFMELFRIMLISWMLRFSLSSIHNKFLRIMPIHNGCLDSLYHLLLLHLYKLVLMPLVS